MTPQSPQVGHISLSSVAPIVLQRYRLPRPYKSTVPRDHQSTLTQSFRRDVSQHHGHRKSIPSYDLQSTLTRSFHTSIQITPQSPQVGHISRSSVTPIVPQRYRLPIPHKSMTPRDHQSTLTQSFRRDVDATDTASRS